MHFGNQLYSSFSLLAKQSYLLLTELPTMLTVSEENYQLTVQAIVVMSMVKLLFRDMNTAWLKMCYSPHGFDGPDTYRLYTLAPKEKVASLFHI